jgi:hypothetical protein
MPHVETIDALSAFVSAMTLRASRRYFATARCPAQIFARFSKLG